MRKLLYPLLLLVLAACQNEEPVSVPRDDFSVVPTFSGQVKGQMRIKFKTLPEDLQVIPTRSGIATEDKELTAAVNQIGATHMERVFPYAGKFEPRTRKAGLHLWYTVTFDENVNPDMAIRTLSAVSNVEEVEPVWVPQKEEVEFPYNDPDFGLQWYLYNSGTIEGSSVGVLKRADISMLEAWEIEKGKPGVIVAIGDEPSDYLHSDLRANQLRNDAEAYGEEGVDDDGNGYVDDVFGYRVNYKTTPGDHGTHVAGTIAAKNNNGMGICGIAGGDSADNGIRFWTCQMGDPAGIKYGADMGAVISTNSWHVGESERTQRVFQDAIDYFVKYAGLDENDNQVGPMKGGIVLSAAGNYNMEPKDFYPASLDHVIAVSALGPDYRKSGYSNYAKWVDISAPGGLEQPGLGIYSTLANGKYGYKSGTSMATPVVTGVVALIVSKFAGPGLTPREVEYRLMRGTKNIDQYNPRYVGKLGVGCVDALLALSDDPVNYPPDVVADKLLSEPLMVAYGEKTDLIFNVSDTEDGTDVSYTIVDSSGTVTHSKDGGRIKLSVLNQDCVPGDYEISLIVTDKGGISAKETFSVKLQPELLKEVAVYPNPVVDVLNIRASMTFSGKVTVQLIDIAGNTVLEKKIDISLSRAGQVDLKGISGGSYTLKLTCNNKTVTRNIIKL